MIVLTTDQMKECDRRTIVDLGIPGPVLMENAGRGCADIVREVLDGDVDGKRVAVVCGKGNNGGDGFVISRYLLERGADVTTYLAGSADDVKGDAALNLKILTNVGHDVTELESVDGFVLPESCDLVVDALLGTGISSAPRGLAAELIEAVNDSFVPVVSVDAPSGVDMDTGQTPGACVNAGWTATMAAPKPGLLVPPGNVHAGEVHVVDIGMPSAVLENSGSNIFEVEEDDVADLLPVRTADAHKGTCGTVSVIAGSTGMTGAAALAAGATLRAGAGKSFLGIPAVLNPTLEVMLPEVMTAPLDDAGTGRLGATACAAAVELAARGDVLLLGPGLGRHDATGMLVRDLVPQLKKPVLIDADALYALEGNLDIFDRLSPDCVLTPHIGEFATLLGVLNDEVLADRLQLAREFAQEHGVTLVLKGHPTVTALPDGRTFVNATGNAGLATAGSGDVLAGVITGLMAQGLSGADAAVAGVWIHGAAGDLAAGELGQAGMTAGDVLDRVPAALREFGR